MATEAGFVAMLRSRSARIRQRNERRIARFEGVDLVAPGIASPQEVGRPEYREREADSGDEDEDLELEKSVFRPLPPSVPGQMDKFLHYLQVGRFVATVEVLTDRSTDDLENIRKNAQKTVDELIKNAGEPVPNDPLWKAICGTPKLKRDMTRMSRHIDFITDLCNKFIEEFDGSPPRIHKIRQATGFMKGILAMDGQEVFNITRQAPDEETEISDLLDVFKVNAMMYIEYIRSHENYTYRHPM